MFIFFEMLFLLFIILKLFLLFLWGSGKFKHRKLKINVENKQTKVKCNLIITINDIMYYVRRYLKEFSTLQKKVQSMGQGCIIRLVTLNALQYTENGVSLA